MSYIIEQVKRRRQERNWSQKYIADCINVSQSFIYKAVIYIFTLINVPFFGYDGLDIVFESVVTM